MGKREFFLNFVISYFEAKIVRNYGKIGRVGSLWAQVLGRSSGPGQGEVCLDAQDLCQKC